MVQAHRLVPTSVTATNVGDGTTVELSWSVVDPQAVKAYQVERYDKGRRRWVPYDQFHGLVTASPTDPLGTPPRRVLIKVSRPGEHSFRVRTLARDGSVSEWVSAACRVYVAAGYLADTGASYVLNAAGDSLRVEPAGSSNVRVLPGTAFILGTRRTITEPVVLPLPAKANWQGIVAINQEGILSVVEGRTTPGNSLRLANITLDANGTLTLEDTRRLWAPTPITIQASTSTPFTITLAWTPYQELNLEGFIVYRGLSPNELKPYAELSRIDGTYVDADVQPHVIYYYAVAAFDPIRQVSPLSEPIAAFAGDDLPPAPPRNLRYTWRAIDRFNIICRLEWDRNTEEDMSHYVVYMQPFDGAPFVPLGEVAQPPEGAVPFFEDRGLVNGETRHYYVIAVDVSNNKSLPSEILTATVGDTVPPAPPVWKEPAYATGGSWGNAWYELYWYPVTHNADGSVCDDLLEYALYASDDEGNWRPITSIPADQTSFRSEGRVAGSRLTLRLTARDRMLNESEPSPPITFTVGDAVPPAPPRDLSVQLRFEDGTFKVVLSWTPPTTNADGTPPLHLDGSVLTDLRGFVIGRAEIAGAPAAALVPIATIDEPGASVYIDASVQRFRSYTYGVLAKDTSGNDSAWSNLVSVVVDDTTPPPPPTWVDLTTGFEGSEVFNVLTWSLDDPDGDLWGTHIYINDSSIPIRLPKSQTSYTHTGLENGRTYTYHLKAVDHAGNESHAASRYIVAGSMVAPAKPTGISGMGIGSYDLPGAQLTIPEVTQTDEDPPRTLGEPGVPSLGGYHIYRSYTGANYRRIATIEPAPGSVVFEDTEDLENGHTYYYRISAFSHLGVEGPLSDPVAVPAGDTTPPEPPVVTYTSELNPTTREATLTFTLSQPDGTEPASSYIGEVSSDQQTWVRFASGSSPLVYQAPVGVARFYRFIALDEAGNASDPTVLSVTPQDQAPPDPIMPSYSVELRADQRFVVTLSWESYTPPEDFQTYRVLQDQLQPVLVGVERSAQVRRFTLTGLRPGIHSFAVVCDDVWGNSSMPQWVIVTLEDATVPEAPAEVNVEVLPLLLVINWPAVTSNTDGSALLDLLHYRVEALDRLPPGEQVLKSWTTTSLSIAHSADPDEGPFFYRVRAEDRYGHASSWAYAPDGYRAQRLESTSLDLTPPPAPVMGSATVGIDESSVDGSRDHWASIQWTVPNDPSIRSLRVYLGSGSPVRFQAVATLSPGQTSYTFHNLLPDTDYQAYVTALDGAGNESDPPSPIIFHTARDVDPVPPPGHFQIIVGNSLLGLAWEAPALKDLDVFELEFAEAPDKDNPIFGSYQPLYRGKATSFVHQKLDSHKAYRYRIRTVDSSGNVSDWVEAGPASPAQAGSADLAAGVILAEHIGVGSIQAQHISTEAVRAHHIKAGEIQADHLAAGSIEARHLKVRLGARNFLVNSAFHLEGTQSLPGWQKSFAAWDLRDASQLPDLPIPRARAAVLTFEGRIWQDVQAPELAGQPVRLSAYVRPEVLDAPVYLELLNADTFEVLATAFVAESGSAWTRLATDPVVLGSPAPRLRVQLRLAGSGSTCYATGFKLEASEVLTDWVPADGEAYSGTREVEISPDGLRVTNGRLLVTTGAGNQVRITGEGLLAGNYDAQGNLLQGVRITAGGLNVSGGMFSLTNAGNTFILDGSGLSAYSPSGTQTFSLTAQGSLTLRQSFTLDTSTDGTGTRILLDSTGLRAYRDETERFSVNLLASVNEPLVRLTGDFELRSADTPNILALTGNALTLQTPAGTAFAVRASPQTGQAAVELAGDFLIRRSANPTEPQLRLEPTGLTLTTAAQQPAIFLGLEGNNPALRLYGDRAEFTISSQGGGVLLTHSGLVGANGSFSLTDTGFSIGNDAVTITKDEGIVIQGDTAGLSVGSYQDPVVRISRTGIDILKDAGLRISAAGTLTLGDGTVAIDATGIHAPAIRAGELVVAAQDGASRIVVKDASTRETVVISPTGLRVEQGALEVRDPNGVATISQGRIVASALQVGIAGSNLVRNGRGDFGNRNWVLTGNGTLTVNPASSDAMGRRPSASKNQVMRFTTSSDGASLSQMLSGVFASGDRIAISGWFRVAMGTGFTVRLSNARTLDEGSMPPLVIPVDPMWQFVRLRAVCTGTAPPIVEIVHTGTTPSALEFTDLVIVRGEVPAEAFISHPEELANTSRYVLIDETGLTIHHGALSITTADDKVRIDSAGLAGPNFSLTKDGLSIEFTNAGSSIMLGSSPGQADMPTDPGLHLTRRVSGSLKGYVSLTPSSGLIIKSLDDETPIFRMESAGGKAILKPNELRMEDPTDASRYVRLTPENGLEVKGGKVRIEGPLDSDGKLEMGFDTSKGLEGLIVRNENNLIEAVLGRFALDANGNIEPPSTGGTWYRGLYLNGGKLHVRSASVPGPSQTPGGAQLWIEGAAIELREGADYVRITPRGIFFANQASNSPPVVVGYAANIDLSPPSGSAIVQLNGAYPRDRLKVVVIPQSILTYDASQAGTHQGLAFWHEFPNDTPSWVTVKAASRRPGLLRTADLSEKTTSKTTSGGRVTGYLPSESGVLVPAVAEVGGVAKLYAAGGIGYPRGQVWVQYRPAGSQNWSDLAYALLDGKIDGTYQAFASGAASVPRGDVYMRVKYDMESGIWAGPVYVTGGYITCSIEGFYGYDFTNQPLRNPAVVTVIVFKV